MKETGEITGKTSLDGDKLYEKRARLALPILVRQAKAEQPVTYGNLAEELGMPNPRNLNFVLGTIGNALLELSSMWNEEIPAIQAIVVNKDTYVPGDGIAWFAKDAQDFKKASTKQKREIIKAMLFKIYKYEKWDKVLQYFNLQPTSNTIITTKYPIFDNPLGESDDHLSLKNYIAHNPRVLGLPQSFAPGKIEYMFGSSDAIDILFQDNNQWIGVEVKSFRSSVDDISRGLYQCVKYSALIEATMKVKQLPLNYQVILAIETDLPHTLISLRNTLDITVYKVIRDVVQ